MEQPIKRKKKDFLTLIARSRLRLRPQEIWERDYPTLTMAARSKKIFWLSDLLTPSARECTMEIWSTPTYTEFDCVALLAMLYNNYSMNPSWI